MNWKKFLRTTHRRVAFVVALPLLVVILSGLLLQFKKEFSWIQPPTTRGHTLEPSISFDAILEAVKTVSEAEIENWDDVDRLDVRPSNGLIKLRANNGWEIQLDQGTGEILQVAYRRSDLIEQIHDGSFFHPIAKHWLFFPAAVGLLTLWVTGIYLFVLPIRAKRRNRLTSAP